MVRTTIACARCRRLKIKCLHGGTSPCRNCIKKGPLQSESCVLSRPELKSKTGATSPFRRRQQQQQQQQQQRRRRHENNATVAPGSSPGILPAVVVLTESQAQTKSQAQAQAQAQLQVQMQVQMQARGDMQLDAIEPGAVLQACATFAHRFPELRFLHQPTFAQRVRLSWTAAAVHGRDGSGDGNDSNGGGGGEAAERRRKLRLLCAAIMAVCGPSSSLTEAERLASLTRKHVTSILGHPPDLVTVQTLVVLSMYDWGVGSGYRAWMHAGMAARMMQSLLVLVRPSSLSAVEREERNRTFWSCFVMDRLVFCGRPQPFTLSMYGPHMHWPAGEQDYIFGGPAFADARCTDQEREPFEFMAGDIDHYYAVLVRGFDVWARIFHFVVNGGRRQPGMCLPENHPWVEGSPWKLLYDELQSWRARMDERLCYPETPVEGHAAFGQAEQFAYVNLLYYVSILLLGREYVPFLPTPESQPAGPVDQPLLPLRAPAGWWAERSEELFAASARIVELLRDLDEAETSLQSPFAGFCSFSAATMNLYVSNFPSMNLGRSGDMSAIVSTNLHFLDAFKKVWPMGRGWWVTIQHCRALYEYASRDREMFQGRTRADFEALEYSIHDSRGQPPTEGEVISPANSAVQRPVRHDHRSGEGTALPATFGPSGTHDLDAEGPGQIWPLWGEQHTVPFALEGVPLNYNLDMLDMYPS